MRPTFVIFGDSLTQQSFMPNGWGVLLANAYHRKVDVINRGYSGYNTRWALPTLPANFPQNSPPPKLVTIWFGANDASVPDKASARQYVPLNEYVNNLKAMVDHVRSIGTEAVILITPPPVNEEARVQLLRETYQVTDPSLVPERMNQHTGMYAEAVVKLAADLGVPSLNLFSALIKDVVWQTRYLHDGLHFTPEGNARVYWLLQELIDSQLPELRVDSLAYDFPLHADIDHTNYLEAFAKHQR